MHQYTLDNTQSVCVWQEAGDVWLQCDRLKSAAYVRMTGSAARQIANTLLAMADAIDLQKSDAN